MIQTERTAIVLRTADYKEYDRMLTLFSPTRGLVEAASRGCRRPRSHLLSASQPFALGDFELFEKNGRATVTGFTLIENFYALRKDYDRLRCGFWLLSLCEAVLQPGQAAQSLFMLLLHTLSRLNFTDQPLRPLLAGFLVNFAACEGFRPRLRHCVVCGRELGGEEPAGFDLREGGLVCAEHAKPGTPPITPAMRRFLSAALREPASAWLEDEERQAPMDLMRRYIEPRLERPLHVQPPEERELP